jgi:hypothetical protein
MTAVHIKASLQRARVDFKVSNNFERKGGGGVVKTLLTALDKDFLEI